MVLSYFIQSIQLLDHIEASLSSDDGEINRIHWEAIIGDICNLRTKCIAASFQMVFCVSPNIAKSTD